MSLPLRIPTPKPPRPQNDCDEYTGIEDLDRPELDDAPDTERDPRPRLPPLDWETDGESGERDVPRPRTPSAANDVH